MMGSDQRSKFGDPRPGIEFADIDPKETAKAWNRFLTTRNAPSIPMTGVRSVIYQSWVRSSTEGVRPEQFAAPSLDTGSAHNKSVHDEGETGVGKELFARLIYSRINTRKQHPFEAINCGAITRKSLEVSEAGAFGRSCPHVP